MGNSFQCARCGETFDKAWSDAEAAEELAETFAGFTPDDCEIVCDDCYKLLMGGTG